MTDLRYGGALRGDIRSRYRRAGAYNVVNSPYSVLPHVFRGRIGPQDVLVDVGCGKGRVINWWLDQGLRNRMVGLEIDPAVASATARRLSAFGNVMIIHDDATTGVPDDATLLYMYNPFDRAAHDALQGQSRPAVSRAVASRLSTGIRNGSRCSRVIRAGRRSSSS